LTTLVEILKAVHAALHAAAIPHAIGGAVALGYCMEEPRGTIDLDVNLFVPTDQVDTVFDALPPEIETGPKARAQVIDRAQVRLYWDDTAVDLFFNDHPFHERAAARVREVPFLDVTIPVLDCTDLVVLKALYSRPKDWIDIAAMIAASSIDTAEAMRWLGSLIGTESVAYRRFVRIVEKGGADDRLIDDIFGGASD
jgi:hypothetical protein